MHQNGLNFDLAQVSDLRIKRDPNLIFAQSMNNNDATFSEMVQKSRIMHERKSRQISNEFQQTSVVNFDLGVMPETVLKNKQSEFDQQNKFVTEGDEETCKLENQIKIISINKKKEMDDD